MSLTDAAKLLFVEMPPGMKRKKNSLSTADLAKRAAQAELIADAAEQQRTLTRAEMKAARKTFKVARRVARKARKKARQAAKQVKES